VTFGTSGATGNITSIEWSGIERGSVDTSYLGSTGARTFIPTDLYDPGELELEIDFDTQAVASASTGGIFDLINAAAETITVTYPIPTGATTGAKYAASGFMTGLSVSVPLEDKVTANATFKMTGALTPTDGS
jgi:hypothetical protein